MQHYGLIGQDANARAVESRAAEVLDFLIRFVDDELLPALTEPELESTKTDMERIRSGEGLAEEIAGATVETAVERLGPGPDESNSVGSGEAVEDVGRHVGCGGWVAVETQAGGGVHRDQGSGHHRGRGGEIQHDP